MYVEFNSLFQPFTYVTGVILVAILFLFSLGGGFNRGPYGAPAGSGIGLVLLIMVIVLLFAVSFSPLL